MVGTIYSLIPALLTIALVVLTRRVVLSLSMGAISAAFILANFSIVQTIQTLVGTFLNLIFEENGLLGFLNDWNLSILFFLLALGVITAYIVLSGGASAFSKAIVKHVNSREGVQYTSALLGILIFVDDYFNALVVGNVSKPLAKQQKISRARLAYIVDSTSAPICVISPISSWATGIMGSMAVIFTSTGATYNTFFAFLQTIPYHFYVITCVLMVFVVIKYNLNLGVMKKYEQDALNGNDSSLSRAEVISTHGCEVESSKGTMWELILPILTLIIVTVLTMAYTGYVGAVRGESEFNLFFAILDNIKLSTSLRVGGAAGLIVSMGLTYRHVSKGEVTKKQYLHSFFLGIKSMTGAIVILLLAWAICDLVGALDAGGYLASIITSAHINPNFIPVVMFIMASLMAFATGTSWGSFGILLPIAGSVAAAIEMNLMIPVMAAVLSGAIFGDHASPISDTTLLSATGSGCDLAAHFNSQLPYALLSAVIASLGYISFGLTESLWIAYLVMFISIITTIFYAKAQKSKVEKIR
ncbi:Na+/H+ antiporter NhaC family protein [Turicibacter sp. TJ11]|uniref:Na+/H+ antiporter NhaC family protein n=1 Tax=Turicibacter sp. TJ11 TaxID=2806443 RepID=UPI001F22741B|nr:Na+/H+ antiporter NhaC family protein [Turicibacter sp. TJ11]